MRPPPSGSSDRAAEAGLFSRVEWHQADVRDLAALSAIVQKVQPTEVYHLAAQSRVRTSWEQPVESADVTALGALRMLEAVRAQAPSARVVMAGSCEVFGPTTEVPQRETSPRRPVSPYGIAKLFAEQMTSAFRERFGLHCGTAILFNHESPRRGPDFVSRKIVRAAVQIARGEASKVHLGNLDVARDWGFAGDHVSALPRMLALDTPEDFVIGTGVAHTVRDFCQLAFQHLGRDYREHLVIDPALVRPDDPPVYVADASRARERLGWTPRVDFAQLVAMMVEAELNTRNDAPTY